MSKLTDQDLRRVELIMNNTPRKILVFRTLTEVFSQLKANQIVCVALQAWTGPRMSVPAHLLSFWSTFARFIGGAGDSRFYEAFCFGDSEELADELAQLVLRGVKRGTTGLLWSFEAESKPLPQPGALSIVTSWAGEPLCVIETESVTVVRFCEVAAEFAAREGEGDGSLAFWQQAHRQFFARECANAGREFSESMLVACECFTLVYARPRGEFSS